jgi:CheY-like chemotaxis protein/HPt (histidine-containing phosphotransfer) domain-containing protein
MMGGEIWADSQPGAGSTFRFYVTLAEAAESEVAPLRDVGGEASVAAALRGAKVLLVEDNEINQQVASELLQQVEVNLDIANNGQEALDCLRRQVYDAVLMDLQMPVMDGYTATRHIRGELGLVELPVLAMTASATAEDSARTLEAGMNAHITKPIDPPNLFRTLARWVSGEELRAPLEAVAPTASVGLALAGIDTEAGIARVGGSESAYRRLLGKFCQNQQNVVVELDGHLRAGDQEAAVRAVHSLKGAAGALGIVALQALAGELEEALGESLEAVGDEALQRLQEQLDKTLDVIDSAQGEDAAGSDPATRPAEIDAALLEQLGLLQQQLEDFDSEADDTLRALLSGLNGSPAAEQLAPLAALVSAYDMEAAAQQLAQIIPRMEEQRVD